MDPLVVLRDSVVGEMEELIEGEDELLVIKLPIPGQKLSVGGRLLNVILNLIPETTANRKSKIPRLVMQSPQSRNCGCRLQIHSLNFTFTLPTKGSLCLRIFAIIWHVFPNMLMLIVESRCQTNTITKSFPYIQMIHCHNVKIYKSEQ